jgi:hypothetical protein
MRSIVEGGTEIAPLSLAESASGALWVASLGRGLYRLDTAMGSDDRWPLVSQSDVHG